MYTGRFGVGIHSRPVTNNRVGHNPVQGFNTSFLKIILLYINVIDVNVLGQALIHLTSILKNHDTDSYTRAGAVWTLGTIGRHSREHARHINDCGAMTAMMDVRLI